MTKINFFTPVNYGLHAETKSQKVIGLVDNYFNLGKTKASVISGRTQEGYERVVLEPCQQSIPKIISIALSYFTIIIPLFLLIVKAVWRATHTYKIVLPQDELERGMNISQSTREKIQGLIPKILNREDDPQIEWISKRNNAIFSLVDQPDQVFKYNLKKADERYENMVKALRVCLIHRLGLLVIPHAKKFTVEHADQNYTFIAEERLKINPHGGVQEHLYHIYGKSLSESMDQMGTFIDLTDYSDPKWGNLPVIDDQPDFQGSRRIALLDIEEMDGASLGFFGNPAARRKGLLGCVNEDQIEKVIEKAKKINPKLIERSKKDRLKDIASYHQLQQFYKEKDIVHGKELLRVDIDSLGINLDEEQEIEIPQDNCEASAPDKQKISLRKVTEDVIMEINELIKKTPDDESPKGKRHFILNTRHEPFSLYKNWQIQEESCLKHIINALVKEKHLFKLDMETGFGFVIQA